MKASSRVINGTPAYQHPYLTPLPLQILKQDKSFIPERDHWLIAPMAAATDASFTDVANLWQHWRKDIPSKRIDKIMAYFNWKYVVFGEAFVTELPRLCVEQIPPEARWLCKVRRVVTDLVLIDCGVEIAFDGSEKTKFARNRVVTPGIYGAYVSADDPGQIAMARMVGEIR